MNTVNRGIRQFYDNSNKSGNQSKNDFLIDDPTTLSFNIFFDFDGNVSKFSSYYENASPLFSESSENSSAYRYLLNINEPDRANNLLKFKKRFQQIVQNYPYYFTELSGIENINLFSPESVFRMSEKRLTINTLESFDLRITELIELYLSSVYDYSYMRQMVTDNLLEFRMYIMVSEIRNFRTFNKQLFSETDNTNDRFISLNNKLNHLLYVFDRCKFDFTESHPYLSSMSSGEPEMAVNSFSIIPGYLESNHKLDFISLLVGETGNDNNKINPPVNDRSKIIDKIKSSSVNTARNLINQQVQSALSGDLGNVDLSIKDINRTLQGNVFGFNNDPVGSIISLILSDNN